MALHIHRAERAETLVTELSALLATPPADPFAAEIVAVPVKGMERWLVQRLSGVLGVEPGAADGVCANISCPTPAALVAQVLAAASGVPGEEDPWGVERLAWPVLRALDAALDEPWAAVPARHLGHGDPGSVRIGRRLATAARIAALFDGYAAQRPSLITDWAAGRDTDGYGVTLPGDLRWQPELWRRVREGLGVASPAERLAAACDRLRAEPGCVALPQRVSLFGVTRLPDDQLAVLGALAEHRDVHLWLVHSTPGLWAALGSDLTGGQAISAPERCEDPVGGQPDPAAVPGAERPLDGRPVPASVLDAEPPGGVPALGLGSDPVGGQGGSDVAWDLVRDLGVPVSGAGVDPTGELDGVPLGSDPVGGQRGSGPAIELYSGGTQGVPVPGLRAADRSAGLVTHPLLAALGRDARELRLRLPDRPGVRDVYHPGDESGSPTVLSALQAGLREDCWPPVGVVPDDGTVSVHACHGAARQVEVLRELLLGVLAGDPTLEPRDVVVLCPDVERYGPLVRAAFGQFQSGPWGGDEAELPHPAHVLRVRPADRSPGAVNPVLAVLEQLFGLADGRVAVTAVLDLAAAEPVRLRCGFTDDDLERLRDWAAETGARWGIGQRQRQAYGLGDFAQNTLNAAVDRILLGVAAGESTADWLELALPLDDVDSGDVDLAGRLAEFTDRLAVCLRDLGGPVPGAPAGSARPAADWLRVLERILDLLTEVPRAQQWLAAQARAELTAALEPAGTQQLRLPDIAALLRGRLAAQAGRTNFGTGELSVCGPGPLRSVPHRVVVLLGLDDEVFPRATGIDGDDVMSRAPRIGERDARSEDRQLLLDAVMAARDRLVLLYTGADPVTGAPRPPAVPVAELLDVLRALTAPVAGPAHPLETVHTRHPLQAFDSRNFDAARPFGFDPIALAGARAAAHPPQPAAPFLAQPLAAPVTADVELADLIAFAEHPVRAFLWQRLGIRVPEEDDEVDDRLPIELDGLTRWNIGERMLAARLTGTEPEVLRAAEWRRGTLPPFGLGAAVLEDVEYTVDRLVRVAQPIHELPSHTMDIAVDLGDGRRLTGTVADIRDDAVVRATFSRLAPKHRMAAWIRVLALAAAHRHQSWRAVTIGRGKFGRPAGRSTLVPPHGAAALTILRDLADLRDEGLTAPLPITPTASALYAERRCAGADLADAQLAAAQEFLGGPNGPKAFGDHTDRCLRYVWGRIKDLDAIDTPLPAPDRFGETTRFGAYSRRLWAPLLAAENQDQP